jgi:hypothetical protein
LPTLIVAPVLILILLTTLLDFCLLFGAALLLLPTI